MSREIAVRIVSFLAVSMAMAVWEFALPWWDWIGGTYRDQPGNQPAGIRKEVAERYKGTRSI